MAKRCKALIMALVMLFSLASPIAVYAETSYPAYSGEPYTVLSGNEPSFTKTEKKSTEPFEKYSSLDSLGRCQVAYANICKEIMPTEPRGDISSVHPTGWQSNMGWERCHLIGFQLAGENANKLNLITGTRYFNVTAMLPFENMVADYVKETGNHVLYRVTPYFVGSELVARGAQMEAWSVEDDGDGICFNIFCHNVQPGKVINYKTGVVSSAELGKSTVTLKAKTATYTGKAISIGSATVKGSTGKVTYTYYTDSNCTTKTTTKCGASSSGKAPKNAGTYYVKASVAADDFYNSATSSAVKLTIKKASSTITLKAKTAGYTGKAIYIGTATVKGSTGTVTYTYYTDSKCTTKTTTKCGASASGKAPKNIGTYYVKAKVAYDDNYYSATSSAVKLTIKKGSSTVTLKAKTATYTGKAISIGSASVSGSTGKVSYTYYTDSKCTTKTTTKCGASASGKAPKNVGTYYVKASVAADSKYNSATSSAVKLTIKKAKSSQTVTVSTTSKTYYASTVKSSAQSFSIGAKAKGSISCSKVSGSSALKVSSSGKVTVAKGTKTGTYTIKVKISAASTSSYNAASSTRTITVKIIDSGTKTNSQTYVLNTNTKKFHYSSCSSAQSISPENHSTYKGSRSDLIDMGYSPCKNCNP